MKEDKSHKALTNRKDESPNTLTDDIFFKKCLFQSKGLTNFSIFEKFCKVYSLDLNNLDITIPKAEKIIKGVSAFVAELKYAKAKFAIFYILKKLGYYSFEQLKQKLNLHQQILTKILSELQDIGIIKEESLLNPKIQYINEILRNAGETKKRKFYTINWENEIVREKIDDVDSRIDESFKKSVLEEINFFEIEKLEYEREKQLLQKKQEHKEKYYKTKLDRIRDVLIPLIGMEYTPQALVKYLHYGQSLITLNSWKGNRGKYGLYSGGWEDYLVSQGFLKRISIGSGKFLLKVTSKVDKDKSFSQIKKAETEDQLTNEEKSILGIGYESK